MAFWGVAEELPTSAACHFESPYQVVRLFEKIFSLIQATRLAKGCWEYGSATYPNRDPLCWYWNTWDGMNVAGLIWILEWRLRYNNNRNYAWKIAWVQKWTRTCWQLMSIDLNVKPVGTKWRLLHPWSKLESLLKALKARSNFYQGTIGCTLNSVHMVLIVFSGDSWGLQPVNTHYLGLI